MIIEIVNQQEVTLDQSGGSAIQHTTVSTPQPQLPRATNNRENTHRYSGKDNESGGNSSLSTGSVGNQADTQTSHAVTSTNTTRRSIIQRRNILGPTRVHIPPQPLPRSSIPATVVSTSQSTGNTDHERSHRKSSTPLTARLHEVLYDPIPTGNTTPLTARLQKVLYEPLPTGSRTPLTARLNEVIYAPLPSSAQTASLRNQPLRSTTPPPESPMTQVLSDIDKDLRSSQTGNQGRSDHHREQIHQQSHHVNIPHTASASTSRIANVPRHSVPISTNTNVRRNSISQQPTTRPPLEVTNTSPGFLLVPITILHTRPTTVIHTSWPPAPTYPHIHERQRHPRPPSGQLLIRNHSQQRVSSRNTLYQNPNHPNRQQRR